MVIATQKLFDKSNNLDGWYRIIYIVKYLDCYCNDKNRIVENLQKRFVPFPHFIYKLNH